ncbi:Uncharacterised protein [Raoultella planticola]|uniref:Uncharacterized protein n=1 Tax=Raoultella planticola TaxID=575 RepID=A0A485A271_RAOPL|nr:Uncharacterised protein [Raoultella planticola]
MSTWRIVGYYLALLVMIVPWRAQAADADDFVAANRTQQARLLEQWAAAPDAPATAAAAGAESGNPGGG